jgi:hypothetical protein
LQRAVGNLQERQLEGENRATSDLRGLLQQRAAEAVKWQQSAQKAQAELKNQGQELQREREEGKIARESALGAEEALKHRIELQSSDISNLTAKLEDLSAEKIAFEEKLWVEAGKREKETANLREQLSLYETEILEMEKKQRESTKDKAKLQEELGQARYKWEAEMKVAVIAAEKIVDDVKANCVTEVKKANEKAGRLQFELEEAEGRLQLEIGELKNELKTLGAKMNEDESRYQAEAKQLNEEICKLTATASQMATHKDAEVAELAMMLSTAEEAQVTWREESRRLLAEHTARTQELSSVLEDVAGVLEESQQRVETIVLERDAALRLADETRREKSCSALRLAKLAEDEVRSLALHTRTRHEG